MKMDSPQDHPSGRKRRPENSKTVKTGPVVQPINRQSTEEINVVKVLPSKTTGHLIPLLLLTIAAGATRLWRLGQPSAVVFDELFYSRFVHMYINRIFFFDSNPPFGKQLIATAAYLAGYGNQNETFEQIGDPYAEDTPIVVLRLLPALFGAFLIPVSYLISTELGYSRFESTVTACCFLFDNALVTGSRFVLIDSINLCLLLLAVLFVLRFTHEACLSYTSAKYGLLTGLFMGLSISTKFLSLNTLLVLGWVVVRHFWKTIDDLTISAGKLWKYLLFWVFLVFWVPLGVYVATFYVHFLVLNKAGPYDAMMSTRFQASLEGGLAAITQGQPYDIAHGSQITLRNVAGVNEEPCWLHSHDAVYPVRYEGTNRGSSHQQQVTCYSFKDVNNWWIVKRPGKKISGVAGYPDVIQDRDIIELVHGISGRLLNR
ncbi:hypothetical protein RvY_06758-2 [Ramazzottius varieornatus]|uniref:dolichyl-phosphate-mannose--protein mannosyltransferase n=1 Tax=Ramazzottius varieornatus TaxID=947166 RepID=A0A1D1V027_RAMVA|nr:hypothetical protein RvY_06758-2 [Ramazzottius varieornatus]